MEIKQVVDQLLQISNQTHDKRVKKRLSTALNQLIKANVELQNKKK